MTSPLLITNQIFFLADRWCLGKHFQLFLLRTSYCDRLFFHAQPCPWCPQRVSQLFSIAQNQPHTNNFEFSISCWLKHGKNKKKKERKNNSQSLAQIILWTMTDIFVGLHFLKTFSYFKIKATLSTFRNVVTPFYLFCLITAPFFNGNLKFIPLHSVW